MSTMRKILRYELRDVGRSRAVLLYGVLLLAMTHAVVYFGGGGARAVLSLLNVILIVVPMVSLVFGTVYLYGAREFIELLLTQPLGRRPIFAGLWCGLTLPLIVAFVLGVSLPFLWSGSLGRDLVLPLALLLVSGALLTAAFTAIATWIATRFDDRASGMGAALAVWFLVAIAWDGMILLVVATLGNLPLQLPLLGVAMANPVDAARIGLVLALDAPALMGYTGAVMQRAVGLWGGLGLTILALLLWTVLPLMLARRRFEGKDF
ncbi:MAG TPA: ABC transporter permease subunit [Gemmatimonadales bacterium]|jgi:Cu-processing system permease protein|nr:ABC transporter permease subunit [Gemmatimonadales bacterium]